MIRTIILDLGRVLVPFDFSRAYRVVSERAGIPPEEVRARIIAAQLIVPFESGQMEPAEFVLRMSQAIGVPMEYDEFSRIWSLIFLPETLIPEEWVRSLHTRYRTVLLSNTNAIHYSMLRANYPILAHFHAYVLSHEVKAMKPDPRIYAAAIEAAQCRPNECFYTDDVPEFVEAGRAAGLEAVQFQNADQLRSQLALRGIML